MKSTAGALLGHFDDHLQARWRVYLLLVCALAAVLSGLTAVSRPLQHDELFTYYVARQDSFSAIYSALVNRADDHPPLDYWIRHASMAVFGPGELAFRLPSIAAFIASLLGLFVLAQRFWGATSGFIAVGVALLSQANSMSYFGRAYSLILLWAIAGLLLWRMATDGWRRRWALAGLGGLFLTSTWLHFYAPFHLAAIVMAEIARVWKRRALDRGMLAAFFCSVLGLPLVSPLLAYAKTFARGFWTPVNLQATLDIYGAMFVFGVPAFFALLMVWALLQWAVPAGEFAPAGAKHQDFGPELVACGYLLLLPFVIFILAKVATGALHSKYAISLTAGAALLMAFAVSRSARLRLAALCTIPVFALGIMGMKAVAALRSGHIAAMTSALTAVAQSTDLPVVVDTPQSFLEGAHYAEAAVRSRLFYLVDPAAALRVQTEDTDQKAMLGLARIAPFQAVPLAQFVREHPRFLLFYEGGWVLHWAVEHHAAMQVAYCGRMPLITIDVSAPAR